MNKCIAPFSLLAALGTNPCLAADDNSAQSLYEQSCVSCHGSEVYTREERKVGSREALESQVRRCEAALELRWFDDEIAGVTQFLNDRYYHFNP
ncbi:MAG: cytochrome c [Chromatiaceae bacterium]|jgi:cytochrome c5|nr:cytochrome c [Chromatiaceae bacterium]